jgi:hypothetical protein
MKRPTKAQKPRQRSPRTQSTRREPRTATTAAIAPSAPQTPEDAVPATASPVPNGVSIKASALETPEQAAARAMVDGVITNAFLFQVASAPMMPAFTATTTDAVLQEMAKQGQAVADGDLSGVVKILNSQIAVLNSVFATCLNKALRAEHYEVTEAYMRMALRAQANCRTNAEAITAITHPPHPAVFAKQANITSGPQQINNQQINDAGSVTRARTGTTEIQQSKLLEARNTDARMDGGATGATADGDPEMETVEAFDGATHERRQSRGSAKRFQGGRATTASRRNARHPRTTRAAR